MSFPHAPVQTFTQLETIDSHAAEIHLISMSLRPALPGVSGPPFVTFSSSGGDLPLHLEFRHGRELVAAQRVNDAWIGWFHVPIDSTNFPSLEISWTATEIRLTVVGQIGQISWPRPVGEELSLEASSCWAFAKKTRLTQDKVDQLVVVDVKPAGLEATFKENYILDIGANNGDDTAFYLAKGFKVVAVEANPTLCVDIAERFAAELQSKQLTLLNVGLTDERGTMTFYINTAHSEWSSFDPAIASRGHPVREVVVKTITTEDIFAAYGVPYFAKIDIEGYDHIPVLAIAGHSVRPKYVSFENGEANLFEALAKAGYDRFQIVNQAFVPYARCPEPALEGLTVKTTFNIGASGPFGRDLPDEWLSADSMRAHLAEHLRNIAERPDSVSGYWYDLHAGLPD